MSANNFIPLPQNLLIDRSDDFETEQTIFEFATLFNSVEEDRDSFANIFGNDRAFSTIINNNNTADADNNNLLANATNNINNGEEIDGLLNYEYYDLAPPLTTVNDIPDSGANATGTVNLDLAEDLVEQADQGDISNFGIRYTGFIYLETPGTYTFYTTSDDGSQLSLDGNLVVDNDGLHPFRPISGTFNVSTSGTYPLEVEYFEAYGEQNLTIEYEGPGITRTNIPSSILSTKPLDGVDYGDAPDTQTGTAIGDYQTTQADGGASHYINDSLTIGSSIDADDGTLQNPDASADSVDEDGISSFGTLQTDDSNYSVSVNVTNAIGDNATNATLVGWIDFDRDGIFSSDEAVSTIVNQNDTQVTLTWDENSTPIPNDIAAGTTYARFRLSTDTNLTPSFSNGLLTDGEVEDYQITIEGVDYGDAPDIQTGTATGEYQTTRTDGGASHVIVSGLSLGRYIDDDTGTLQNTLADADDDDILQRVTTDTNDNSTPENATNNGKGIDGLLNYEYYDLDAPLKSIDKIPDSGANATGTVNLDLAEDLVAQADQDDISLFGIRYTGFIYIETPGTYTFYTTSDDGSQLSINGNLVVDNDEPHPFRSRSGTFDFSTPGTYALEVEYFEEFGDQNLTIEYEGPGITRTNIPSSIVSTSPDDEDSISSFATLQTNNSDYSVTVNVTNTTEENANLVGWIDFDRDGVFSSDEAVSTTVNNNDTEATLTWEDKGTPIPDDIVAGTTYARFRLSTDTNLTTSLSTSLLSDGEVEDYQISIVSVIDGNSGSEEITGSTEDDIITGGEGQDTLTGNGGNDQFVFTKTSDGVDIIQDFDRTEDILDFSAIIAGELSEVTFTSNPFADGYVVATAFGSHTMIQVDFNLADSLANKDVVLLQNVDFGTIDASDFIFA